MRIGLLFEYSSLNGGEHSILAAIDQLSAAECDFVGILVEEGPLSEELRRRSIPTSFVRLRDECQQRVLPSELAEQLKAVLSEHQLDLLHANSLTSGRLLGAITEMLPVPTSSHIRDIMKLSKSAVADLNRHQKLFAVSDATRVFHQQQGIDTDRIVTVYNGVDCNRFSPRSATGWLKNELGVPDDALLAVTIGQICLRKAQNDLAKAASILRDQCPNVHYVIVGERYSTKTESIEFDDNLSQVFHDAGMADRLHRLGYCDDIPSLLNECDFLVHPARQEPLGRVLLEAAASGLPIIATDAGGTKEILTDEIEGILIPPASPRQLADAIKRVVNFEMLRDQLAAAARERVLKHFNIQQRTTALHAQWRETLS